MYLEEIYQSVYKRLLSAIDHFHCNSSMNSTKQTDSQDLTITSKAETLCKKYTTDSQPFYKEDNIGN